MRNNPLAYTDPYGWWTFGLSFSIGFSIGFSVNIGISIVFDNQGNIVVTRDLPGIEGSSSLSFNLGECKGTYTTKDTVYDLLNTQTYTDSIGGIEGLIINPGIIADDNGLIGGSISAGAGLQWPPLSLAMGESDPPADIIATYTDQSIGYSLLNIVSPNAAFYYDYYYDGKIDYGYNYDAYYYYYDSYNYYY